MRATCGVMSGRTPIVLPESWSTTLKVRSSRSWPVPVRSESMYSRSGGMTSPYLLAKKRSRSERRSLSMRIASAGRMSSTYSGSSHFLIKLAPRPEKEQEADDDGREPDEADLAIGHLRDAAERLAPKRRRDEGKHAFEHQHQGEGHEESGPHAYFLGEACRPSESRK